MSEYIVIAGIAAKDQAQLSKYLIKNGLRKTNTIAFLTVAERNPVYKKTVIEAMITSLAQTVSKKLPDNIRVIYIPYKNSNILKELLFPFSDIQALDDSQVYYEYVLRCFKSIDELGRKLLEVIRCGLKIKSRPSKKHYVMLPNNNFILGKKIFGGVLSEFYFGDLDEAKFRTIKKNNEFDCYEDSRNLAFPVTKMHEGNLRFNKSRTNPRHYLNGIYRLGFSWHPGFHFDVQHSSKSTLSGCRFTCSVKGEVEGRGMTHVNIYLNDFVRVPSK